MNCEETRRWIGPLLDGELDARNTSDLQGHLATCPSCERDYEVEQTISAHVRHAELRYAAPASLRARIASEINKSSPTPAVRDSSRPGARRNSWLLWAGWPVAVAASGLLGTLLLQQRSLEANAVVAAHVRSLLADHLNDVLSTDRHTVKPWFAGKLDFSPPVPDLSSEGFELIGGRLDYLRHEPVAALIYRKHGHVINVLSSPTGRELDGLPHIERLRGYSLRAWHQGGLDVAAVSDIDPTELARLEKAYSGASSSTGEPSS